ncbi:hypothetical protein [Streptomyces sp. NPDC054854]
MGRRTPLIAATTTTATLLLIGGCHHEEPDRPWNSTAAPLARVPTVSPGFPPTAAGAKARLAGLKVEWGKNWQTYRREEFGRYWSDETDAVGGRNGCDTRVISMVRAVVGLFSQRMQGVVACAS